MMKFWLSSRIMSYFTNPYRTIPSHTLYIRHLKLPSPQ
uniref:Uncharacterized protein n=1 Tax=Anguilla anguilla TaxID=7936 RepID=A0A0E9U4S0_ANGAN